MKHTSSLNQCAAGHTSTVSQITGDVNLYKQLISMGIRVGTEITLLQQNASGCVVAFGSNRMAISHSLADNLLMNQP